MVHVRFSLLLFALPAVLAAQAAVEYAAGAARAATTTAAPAQSIGKSTGGAFDKLNRTLQDTQKTTPAPPKAASSRVAAPKSAAVQPVSVAPAPAPKPEVAYEDPSGIQEGIEYAEVIRRFGPPSLMVTAGQGQETLCYAQKDQNFDVTVLAGKVTSVQRTGGRN